MSPEQVNEAFEYEIEQSEVKDRGLTATDQFKLIQQIELLWQTTVGQVQLIVQTQEKRWGT